MTKDSQEAAAKAQNQAWMSAAHRRFLEAIKKRPGERTPSADVAIEREVWEAAYEVLQVCAFGDVNSQPLVLPPEIVHFFTEFVGDILAGHEPDTLKRLRSGRAGAPRRGELESQQINMAVAYVFACRDKLIDDHAPTQTVSRLFGVAPTTVRGWCRGYSPTDIPPIHLLAVSQGKTFTDLMRELLEYGSKEYRAASHNRSKGGVVLRNRKGMTPDR